jgi:cell fate regulator YaaT (PSP1 superfamily)
MNEYYNIEVNEVIHAECVDTDHLTLKKNDWCIIRYPNYEDYGRVIQVNRHLPDYDGGSLPTIKRRATLVDQGKAHENSVRCKSFHRQALEAIKKSKTPMRLIATHFTLDRSLIIFSFTSPDRVDFRELVKDMTRILSCRVEFRQIGPRDYAGLVGGVDTCGRVLCCSSFLTNFVTINMKMAKEQGLSLNPTNIIGACGRLKCCLSYEYEGYRELMRNMPKPGSRCQCQGCDGAVVDTNPLTQTVKVSLEDGARVITVPVSEVLITS